MRKPKISRATAASINPIISLSSKADTLSNCAQLIEAIGYAVEGGDAAICSQVYKITDAVVAAMTYEMEGREL